MKYLKRFNESLSKKPGENISGSAKMELSDKEMEEFNDNISLQKLITDDKISILNNSVWYWEEDEKTTEILNQYLNQ